jgi:hypothetical protein
MSISALGVRSDRPGLPAGQYPTRRQRWIRAAVLVASFAAAVALVLWANWMVQRYLILSDDTARGEQFRAALEPTGTPGQRENFVFAQCRAAAETFYGHRMFDGQHGWAPPNEKAFFHACSGVFLGGRGGGGGD